MCPVRVVQLCSAVSAVPVVPVRFRLLRVFFPRSSPIEMAYPVPAAAGAAPVSKVELSFTAQYGFILTGVYMLMIAA